MPGFWALTVTERRAVFHFPADSAALWLAASEHFLPVTHEHRMIQKKILTQGIYFLISYLNRWGLTASAKTLLGKIHNGVIPELRAKGGAFADFLHFVFME